MAIPVKDCKNISAGYRKKVHVHAKHDPNNAHITEILDSLKQRLSVKSQRLRQYKEANGRKQQNKLFTTNEKTYCRNLNENLTLYWNCSILMDKTIPFNRSHVTFMNKKTKNTFLIDIAVPNTHNLAKTITNKQYKYQELANEICSMWKQKAAQVIPILSSSTVVIPKSLSQSLTRLNLHLNTYIQLQKSVILGICSIVRNFLNFK